MTPVGVAGKVVVFVVCVESHLVGLALREGKFHGFACLRSGESCLFVGVNETELTVVKYLEDRPLEVVEGGAVALSGAVAEGSAAEVGREVYGYGYAVAGCGDVVFAGTGGKRHERCRGEE